MAMVILDDKMEVGQVKTITSDFGRKVEYTELLFSPTTKVQFRPNENETGILFSVSDNNFDLPELVCEIDRDTIRSLIVSLKNIYNGLSEPTIPVVETPKTEQEKAQPSQEKICCY